MDDKSFNDLKEERSVAFQAREDALDNFKKTVLSHQKVNFPEGFDLRVHIDSRSKLSGIEIDEVKMYLENTDRQDGKGKYFWTLGARTELEYKDNALIEYNMTAADGGYNGTHYGAKDTPQIDAIEISELTIKLNIAQLNILKIAKNTPEVLLVPLEKYRDASENLNRITNEYQTEERSRKMVQRRDDLETIGEGFDTISPKIVEKLKNKLKNSDDFESSVSVVGIDSPVNNYTDDLNVKKYQIICKKGGRTTYAVKEGCMVAKPIKAADVDIYLSKGVVFDGKRSESIEEFFSQLPQKVDVATSYSNQVSIEISKLSEVAKVLTENKSGLEVKQKASKNKLK